MAVEDLGQRDRPVAVAGCGGAGVGVAVVGSAVGRGIKIEVAEAAGVVVTVAWCLRGQSTGLVVVDV